MEQAEEEAAHEATESDEADLNKQVLLRTAGGGGGREFGEGNARRGECAALIVPAILAD